MLTFMEVGKIEKIKEYNETYGIMKTLIWIIRKSLGKAFSIFYQNIVYHVVLIYLDRFKTNKIPNEKQFNIRRLQDDDLKIIETKLGKPVSSQDRRSIIGHKGRR